MTRLQSLTLPGTFLVVFTGRSQVFAHYCFALEGSLEVDLDWSVYSAHHSDSKDTLVWAGSPPVCFAILFIMTLHLKGESSEVWHFTRFSITASICYQQSCHNPTFTCSPDVFFSLRFIIWKDRATQWLRILLFSLVKADLLLFWFGLIFLRQGFSF